MKSRYKPKKLKFSGEESFMVPKEGQKFLLAVGADVVAIDKQNAENIDVAPLEPTTVTNPSVVSSDTQVATPPAVVIPVPDWQSMDCPTIQSELNQLEEMLTYSRFTPDILSQYQSIIENGKSVYNSKCGGSQLPVDEVPPAPPVITEPSWSSLTCDQVVSEITALQEQLARGQYKLGQENYDNVQKFIQNGKSYYDSNCAKTQSTPTDVVVSGGGGGVGAPPITTITTTGTPIIATASTGGLGSAIGGVKGGGGSSGGGGAKEEPKKKTSWLWLVAIVGGVYLLTRKK
jgi:hypothetical protein